MLSGINWPGDISKETAETVRTAGRRDRDKGCVCSLAPIGLEELDEADCRVRPGRRRRMRSCTNGPGGISEETADAVGRAGPDSAVGSMQMSSGQRRRPLCTCATE